MKYNLYKKKIDQISIDSKVKSIKEDENFLSYDEIPEDFCNAIVDNSSKLYSK